jgi:hypothetical protein
MAQSASATLKANAQSASRVVSVLLQIAWGRSGDEWPTDWATQATNETTRLKGVSWDRNIDIESLSAGRGGGTVAQMRVMLENSAQRFSPLNSAGALYSSLSADGSTAGGESVRYPTMWQTPVRLSMGFYDSIAGHERIVVFSGLIDAVNENYGLNGDQVEFTCLDRGALLLQRKASTKIYEVGVAGWTGTIDAWIRYMVSTLGGIETGSAIGRGLHIVKYMWLDDENLWSEAQTAAGSEAGCFFFDENGLPTFRNATWWLTATDSKTSQATFTTARLQNLTPAYDYKGLTTGALVHYQPRTNGGEQVIWRREGIVVTPAGVTIDARFSHPVLTVTAPAKGTDWYPVSSGGANISNFVNVTIPSASRYAQRAVLQFTNTSTQTAFIPAMKLRGVVLAGGPQEELEQNVTTPLVPENQAVLGGNAYVQNNAQAELLAALAAYRNSYPRLTYQIGGAPALPWLQLGDMVTIDTSEPITADRYAIITGLSFSWQPEGPFLMNVTAVDKAALFEHTDYHVIGTDDYGDGVVYI